MKLLNKNCLRFILFLFLIYVNNITAEIEYDEMGMPLPGNTIKSGFIYQISYDLKFAIDDTLEFPTNLEPGPGQLSKDGLEYYLSLEDTSAQELLYVLKRSEIGQTFGQPELFEGKINDPSFRNHQPTITSDKKTIVFVRSTVDSWTDNDLYIAIRSDTTLPFDSVRPLVEINTPSNADAYPCITPKGLKLYYTKAVDNSNYLFYSTRESTSDSFSSPQLINVENCDGKISSAWLWNDGLHMFLSADHNQEFIYSNRSNINEPFKAPELLTDFVPYGLVCGASMIRDELYIRNNLNDTARILKFISDSLTINIKGQDKKNSGIFSTKNLYSILPNPVRSLATIKFNCNIRSAKLDIYNLKGELVYILSEINGNQIIWDAELLPPGPYFVSLKVDKTSHNQKILLIK